MAKKTLLIYLTVFWDSNTSLTHFTRQLLTLNIIHGGSNSGSNSVSNSVSSSASSSYYSIAA